MPARVAAVTSPCTVEMTTATARAAFSSQTNLEFENQRCSRSNDAKISGHNDNDFDDDRSSTYSHCCESESDFEFSGDEDKSSTISDDLSTTTIEVEPAGPPQDLTALQCLEHLPTAVGLCPPDDPQLGLNLFIWAATAICRVVKDVWNAGEDPFADGGVVETIASPSMRELAPIHEDYYEIFDDECEKLNQALACLSQQEEKLRWSTRSVVELEDDVTPAEECHSAREMASVVPPVGRRSKRRSEKRDLEDEECVAHRTRARSGKQFSAGVKATRSKVRAGKADLVAGME